MYMKMNNEKLIALNQAGFIPGPEETEEKFIERVKLAGQFFKDKEQFLKNVQITPPFPLNDKVTKPLRHWSRSQLIRRFDITPDFLHVYFHDQGLTFFQGAVTWLLELDNEITLPLLQFRKGLKKGRYLGLYSFDEILAHETVHAARSAFNEKIFEEHFAYLTSSSFLRRIFGPIIKNTWEIIVLFVLFIFVFTFAFFPFSSLLSYLGNFSFFGLLGYASLGFFRLFKNRLFFVLALKKLKKILRSKDKALHVMFRLTDKEIFKFAVKTKEKILSYAVTQKERSLRWQVIYLAYFAGSKSTL